MVSKKTPAAVSSADCRAFGYEADDGWAKLPSGMSWPEVAAVAADSRDRIYVFNRGAHPVMVFDRGGTFLFSWGQGLFVRPHGMCIGPDDSVYCTDDSDHTVRKYTPDGQLLLTLGTSGKPSDTGATSMDFRTILRSGPPFHYPTNLALSPEGDLYISDGYGNARVHKFSADGQLLFSWGEPGSGPGQFRITRLRIPITLREEKGRGPGKRGETIIENANRRIQFGLVLALLPANQVGARH